MPRAATPDHVSLFYKDWGPRDGSPFVLLHGWPLTADTFDDLAVALAEDGYRSIVPDRRGFGRSDQPWDGYDYDTFASDVDAVLEDAGISGTFAVAGFSMGGGEVARYVAKHGQDRLRSVVFASAVPPYMLKTGDNPDGPLSKTEAGVYLSQLQVAQRDLVRTRCVQLMPSAPFEVAASAWCVVARV